MNRPPCDVCGNPYAQPAPSWGPVNPDMARWITRLCKRCAHYLGPRPPKKR